MFVYIKNWRFTLLLAIVIGEDLIWNLLYVPLIYILLLYSPAAKDIKTIMKEDIDKDNGIDVIQELKEELRRLTLRVTRLEAAAAQQHGQDASRVLSLPVVSHPVVTRNEAGFMVGDVVRINWDRKYWSRKPTGYEGSGGVVKKVSPKFVWVDVVGVGSALTWHQKRNHNVTLLEPLAGSEITACGGNVIDRNRG
jgi:hypothetical protein